MSAAQEQACRSLLLPLGLPPEAAAPLLLERLLAIVEAVVPIMADFHVRVDDPDALQAFWLDTRLALAARQTSAPEALSPLLARLDALEAEARALRLHLQALSLSAPPARRGDPLPAPPVADELQRPLLPSHIEKQRQLAETRTLVRALFAFNDAQTKALKVYLSWNFIYHNLSACSSGNTREVINREMRADIAQHNKLNGTSANHTNRDPLAATRVRAWLAQHYPELPLK